MRIFFSNTLSLGLLFLLVAPVSFAEHPSKAAKKVKVKIDFIYNDFPGKIEVYDVKDSSKFDISETNVVSTKEELPVTKKNKGAFTLSAGESRTVVLVVENTTGRDWYFNATPHSILPIEASVAQKFECLCNHSIFNAKKKSFWYRIVRLDLEKDFTAPSIKLTHNIIGVKNADAKGKYKDLLHDK